jgi:uncharacterized protein (TIGR02145 family)
MKMKLSLYGSVIVAAILQFNTGCEREFMPQLTRVPDVTTQPATNVQLYSAMLKGTVNAFSRSSVVTFEYGNDTMYGSMIKALQSPVAGNMITVVSAEITGLSPNTEYHFRVKAENSSGSAFGEDMIFKSLSMVTDADGNVYQTVAIGPQVWMAENLKTTKYRDGTQIPDVTDDTVWGLLTTGGLCWYDNDSAKYNKTYGAMYNYFAVTNSHNLCPAGWHIPDIMEWVTLEKYLGGSGVAGAKMKEAGTIHWASPNTFADNISGFSGLPGGYRSVNGEFLDFGFYGFWWSSSEYSVWGAWILYLGYGEIYTYKGYDVSKTIGFSVRCLMD